MVEFRINTKQTKKTFSGLQASKIRRQNSSDGSYTDNLSNKYAIRFNNMFANVTNAKSGCRSCRGTF